MKLETNSLESVFWIVDVWPSLAGFSSRKQKVFVPFWIIHTLLLSYVYIAGNLEFQLVRAQGARDFIKSYVNISIFTLVANSSWWFLKKRTLLRTVLKQIELNDRLARRSPYFEAKHEKLMKIVKRIILIFYGANIIDGLFIYWPARADVKSNNFSMTPCVGLHPLTTSPNREICVTILAVAELSVSTAALNFQALLLLLIAQTAVMYQMLAAEMLALNENEDSRDIKALARETLPLLVNRHSLTLDIVDKLQSLYSVPIGVNFGSNAVCISFFFYLPLREWFQFGPILIYCFLVFFLYCYLCQRLINASEAFESSVYCCGWENFEVPERKMIYSILRQAQKPIQLLAADIIPVNIATFATTLQAMFKFVTVVKV